MCLCACVAIMLIAQVPSQERRLHDIILLLCMYTHAGAVLEGMQ